MKEPFQVDQIDHIELFVPDRYAAAAWYHKVLGLQVVEAFKLGQRVTQDHVRDHHGAYSIYFSDPYRHRIETTTYDYDVVKSAI